MDLGDIIIAAGYTGMRKGELLKLKCRDVDFRLNVIHVGGSLMYKPRQETIAVFPSMIGLLTC